MRGGIVLSYKRIGVYVPVIYLRIVAVLLQSTGQPVTFLPRFSNDYIQNYNIEKTRRKRTRAGCIF